jgi:8-oxo-dGTP pyrophosphatase MutT (NUDIX family)
VKAICEDEQGRILLVREADGLWEMMGGGLEHGEDPIDCLRREVHEETGLTITSISKQPKYFLTAHRQSRDDYVANIIYVVTLQDLDFTPSDECQEMRYFTVEEMASIEKFPNVQALYELLQR